jgi:hypothetical protein
MIKPIHIVYYENFILRIKKYANTLLHLIQIILQVLHCLIFVTNVINAMYATHESPPYKSQLDFL